STEVNRTSGRTPAPASASSCPADAASLAPVADSGTSTQPVNSPSAFQVLSPWRSRITVPMAPEPSGAGALRRNPAEGPGGADKDQPGTSRGPAAKQREQDGGARGCLLRRCMPVLRRLPRRIAMISLHTSPLEQPGTGDAGGLNVYVVEVARR